MREDLEVECGMEGNGGVFFSYLFLFVSHSSLLTPDHSLSLSTTLIKNPTKIQNPTYTQKPMPSPSHCNPIASHPIPSCPTQSNPSEPQPIPTSIKTPTTHILLKHLHFLSQT